MGPIETKKYRETALTSTLTIESLLASPNSQKSIIDKIINIIRRLFNSCILRGNIEVDSSKIQDPAALNEIERLKK